MGNALKVIGFFVCFFILLGIIMVSIGNSQMVLTSRGLVDANEWSRPKYNTYTYEGEREHRLNIYIRNREAALKRKKIEEQNKARTESIEYDRIDDGTSKELTLDDIKIHIVKDRWTLRRMFPQFRHPLGVADNKGNIWIPPDYDLATLGHEIQHLLNWKYPRSIKNPDKK